MIEGELHPRVDRRDEGADSFTCVGHLMPFSCGLSRRACRDRPGPGEEERSKGGAPAASARRNDPSQRRRARAGSRSNRPKESEGVAPTRDPAIPRGATAVTAGRWMLRTSSQCVHDRPTAELFHSRVFAEPSWTATSDADAGGERSRPGSQPSAPARAPHREAAGHRYHSECRCVIGPGGEWDVRGEPRPW